MGWYDSWLFPAFFALLLAVGYLLVLFCGPVAGPLGQALAILWRHPRITFIFVGFAFSGALLREFLHAWWLWGERADASGDFAREWWTIFWQPPGLRDLWILIWQPVLQNSLAVFHCAITAFPLSTPLAVVFLCNAGGLCGEILRQTWRRFHLLGIPLCVFALAAAVAAVIKPFFLWPPEAAFDWPAFVALREAALWLAFGFEYGLGVFIQVGVALRALEWLRGMQFEEGRLGRATARRFVVLWPWWLAVFFMGSTLLHLPRLMGWGEDTFPWRDVGFAVIMLILAPLQAILIFHNLRFGKALASCGKFQRHHAGVLFWFVGLTMIHWILLESATTWLGVALGGSSNLFGALARVLVTIPSAALMAWMLCGWFCLFRKLDSDA